MQLEFCFPVIATLFFFQW